MTKIRTSKSLHLEGKGIKELLLIAIKKDYPEIPENAILNIYDHISGLSVHIHWDVC